MLVRLGAVSTVLSAMPICAKAARAVAASVAAEASAVAVQSVVADGVFVELSLSRGLWQANGQRLSAVLTQGADFGYATPQYDGLNHNGLGLHYVNRLASGWQLGLAVDHNRGGPDVRRSGGGDVTWLSVSLSR